ncbi:MAG: hypothetical protein IT245_07815 [Bacteroidia bacterium]|nr:hypothetical protein [Bacteroidia bacterium]
MKQFLLLLFFSLFINYSDAKSIDSATIVVFGKSYVVKVGDTLQLGYGTNPDGSFMYLSLGAGENQTGLGKEFAGKTVVIKKIRYFKITDQI